jgi:hypothetical protein
VSLRGERASLAPASDIWVPTLYPKDSRFFRLFISHTSAHKREVGLLRSSLSAVGVAGFVAHDSIHPTLEWQGVILEALNECEALAAYLTSDFKTSDWTDQEVGVAVARGLPILPLRVDLNPYGFIGKYQAMPAGGDSHQLADRIASALHRNSLTKQAMAEAVVDKFARSSSYSSTRDNFKRLQQLELGVWTPDLKRAVLRACRDNDQIANADRTPEETIPAAVRRLLGSTSPFRAKRKP